MDRTNHKMFMLIALSLFLQYADFAQSPVCDYEILNCKREEFSCDNQEKILLDSKNSDDNKHCLAILNKDIKNLENYEISVDMLSLESKEGINSGYLGIAFNFIDQMNYDFIFLE